MLIIIEGPDCAGKSTLARRLVTELAVRDPGSTIELLHRGPPQGHPLDEYVVPLIDYRPDQRRHIICDRWHLGELVYPRIYGRPTKMDNAVFSYVEQFLTSRGALTVVLVPPTEQLLSRLRQRGDAVATADVVVRAGSAFRDIDSNALYFSLPSVDRVLSCADISGRCTPSRHFTTHVGHHRPTTLFLGDVRGTALGPAFMPYPATSGHYLLRSLHPLLPGTAIANACDVDDVHDLWDELDHPSVVALGRNSHRRLTSLQIPHAVAPHPQYVRRFHHRAYRLYGQLLRELTGTERDELGWRPSVNVPDSRSTST